MELFRFSFKILFECDVYNFTDESDGPKDLVLDIERELQALYDDESSTVDDC